LFLSPSQPGNRSRFKNKEVEVELKIKNRGERLYLLAFLAITIFLTDLLFYRYFGQCFGSGSALVMGMVIRIQKGKRYASSEGWRLLL
jgi:hypothetical protein